MNFVTGSWRHLSSNRKSLTEATNEELFQLTAKGNGKTMIELRNRIAQSAKQHAEQNFSLIANHVSLPDTRLEQWQIYQSIRSSELSLCY